MDWKKSTSDLKLIFLKKGYQASKSKEKGRKEIKKNEGPKEKTKTEIHIFQTIQLHVH